MGVDSQAQDASGFTDLLAMVRAAFADAVEEISDLRGEATVTIRRESLGSVMASLKQDSRFQFELLADITAVDYASRKPRFEVVYHLLSLAKNLRLRVKVRVDGKDPMVDSLTALWGSANWLEREVWDMFGIRFAGHPDLKRILLYEGFEGHPLRKDYPMRKRQPLIGPKI
jgi:NADH-quinone oxidoreductase subunit C